MSPPPPASDNFFSFPKPTSETIKPTSQIDQQCGGVSVVYFHRFSCVQMCNITIAIRRDCVKVCDIISKWRIITSHPRLWWHGEKPFITAIKTFVFKYFLLSIVSFRNWQTSNHTHFMQQLSRCAEEHILHTTTCLTFQAHNRLQHHECLWRETVWKDVISIWTIMMSGPSLWWLPFKHFCLWLQTFIGCKYETFPITKQK